MCDRGTGFLLITGASTLACYYADINSYLVASDGNVGLVDYVKPDYGTLAQIAAASAIGVMGSKAIIELQRCTPAIDSAVAAVINVTSWAIPSFARQPLVDAAAYVSSVQRYAQTTAEQKLPAYYDLKNDNLRTNYPKIYRVYFRIQESFVAAIFEEATFRTASHALDLGLQVAFQAALEKFGIPKHAASALAISIGAVIFSEAHAPTNKSDLANRFYSGVIFGVMMHFFGLKGAIASHFTHNAFIKLRNT